MYPLALDRITGISKSKVKFKRNNVIDFEEYFRDIVGVTRIADREAEDIHLRFTDHRFPYVVSKPIHGSQQTVNDEGCEVVIHVIPNNELQQMLFSFGPDVEVLSPEWLRNEMAEKILETAKKYSALHAECKEG